MPHVTVSSPSMASMPQSDASAEDKGTAPSPGESSLICFDFVVFLPD